MKKNKILKEKNMNIGENVTITDRSQLLSITPEQAKKIKSLRIENQVINYEEGDDFQSLFASLGKLDSLCFYKCVVDSFTLSSVKYTSTLRIIECDLTSDLARGLLEHIRNWDYIDVLDLSHNRIGDTSERFFSWLLHSIIGNTNIGYLILSDNGFSEEYKAKVVSTFKDYSAYCKITF